jgi:succinoglycan biosynthesis protein ExoL
MKIVMFALDRNEARLVKRLSGLRANEAEVWCFSFTRSHGGPSYPMSKNDIDLGMTHDGKYLHRFFRLLRATTVIWKNRATLKDAGRLYAINMDNAALAIVAGHIMASSPPIALEIADVQKAMMGSAQSARILRLIERWILKRIDLLVTTSPGFVANYFLPIQGRSSGILILENKIYPPLSLPCRPRLPPLHGEPWVVGYFGALACEKSWAMIKQLATLLGDRVFFVLYGFPTFTNERLLREEVGVFNNIEYRGYYTYPDSIPLIYSQIHLAWGFDFRDDCANSKWCLPNRIYESGYCGVPLLAQKETETGTWVDTHKTGVTFTGDLVESLRLFLETLTLQQWEEMCAFVATAPQELFVGAHDYEELVAHLGPVRR